MKKEKLKNQKGITLLSLVVYMIVILGVLGILATVNNFLYGNMQVIRSAAQNSSEFDKFNYNFLKDVQTNSEAMYATDDNTVTSPSSGVIYHTVVFANSTSYKYNANDHGIYKNGVKIVSDVTKFEISTTQSGGKNVIYVALVIGNDSKSAFSKTMNYTLKYW